MLSNELLFTILYGAVVGQKEVEVVEWVRALDIGLFQKKIVWGRRF